MREHPRDLTPLPRLDGRRWSISDGGTVSITALPRFDAPCVRWGAPGAMRVQYATTGPPVRFRRIPFLRCSFAPRVAGAETTPDVLTQRWSRTAYCALRRRGAGHRCPGR